LYHKGEHEEILQRASFRLPGGRKPGILAVVGSSKEEKAESVNKGWRGVLAKKVKRSNQTNGGKKNGQWGPLVLGEGMLRNYSARKGGGKGGITNHRTNFCGQGWGGDSKVSP